MINLFLMKWEEAAASAGLIVLVAMISFIDLRRQIIPDFLNAALGASGAAFRTLMTDASFLRIALEALLIAVAFGLLATGYSFMRKRVGLGWGDVKLMAAATCWVGWLNIPMVTLVGSVSGLAYVLARQALVSDVSPQTRISFGPHLCLGLAVVWFVDMFIGGA